MVFGGMQVNHYIFINGSAFVIAINNIHGDCFKKTMVIHLRGLFLVACRQIAANQMAFPY